MPPPGKSHIHSLVLEAVAHLLPSECIGREFGYKPYCARFSDIWALGVILINMITGRHPWQKATMGDRCFAQFVRDPDAILDMLPVSDSAHRILKRILALNPLARISLRDLRTAVLELEITPEPSAPGGLIATAPLALERPKALPLRRVRPSGLRKVATGSWNTLREVPSSKIYSCLLHLLCRPPQK